MKAYDETSITSSESMTDLKREVARSKTPNPTRPNTLLILKRVSHAQMSRF